MKTKVFIPFLLFLQLFLLSGCLYPQKELSKNQIAYQDQLDSVQSAIEQFQKDSNGLLPIKTRDMKTPLYQKYPIDFTKVVPRYIAEPPGTAYENGGVYLYVLTDVEEDPTVKLMDVRISEKIRDLKMNVMVYRQKNGYPPYKELITNTVYTLDHKKLGLEEAPQVRSPISGELLPLVIDNQGEVYVDYRIDLFKIIKNNNLQLKQGEDILDIIPENSQFVPAHSLPYTVNEKNEPIFLEK
ncbi:hypothetical protein [Metabacillus arenae]|uniref:Lipoprotein n=1 Tax=Metabacillus arenae TaxID=2771434 RepID=A0A926NIT2_9BACI|nr:hypothetical protein [Metabacillus arenae]MBD1378621.1 hypothetical protein [Metabacillus arenae]